MTKSIQTVLVAFACVSCAGRVATIEREDTDGGTAEQFEPSEDLGAEQIPQATPEVAPSNSDVESTRWILDRTASVVEGQIQGVRYAYDEVLGPRTIYTLNVDTVYAGSQQKTSVMLSMFGGPTNDGRTFGSSLSTTFIIGARYIVFLKNGEWFDTPLATTALRVDTTLEREVLADSAGHVLHQFTPEGLRFGIRKVFSESETDNGTGNSVGFITNVNAKALRNTLNRADFRRLLLEAIVAENAEPRGAFQLVPHPTREKWNIVPTAPSTTNGGGL